MICDYKMENFEHRAMKFVSYEGEDEFKLDMLNYPAYG